MLRWLAYFLRRHFLLNIFLFLQHVWDTHEHRQGHLHVVLIWHYIPLLLNETINIIKVNLTDYL
jgi:hypothetical protein